MTYFGFSSDESWQKAVSIIEEFLLQEIRSGREYVTYTDLVSMLNPLIPRPQLNLESQGDRNAVAAMLGDVSKRCRLRGEPMLSSVVVRTDTMMPGSGWWPQAKLAGYAVDSEEDRLRAFSEEYAKCMAVYRDPAYELKPETTAD